jgi:hypothetical protein
VYRGAGATCGEVVDLLFPAQPSPTSGEEHSQLKLLFESWGERRRAGQEPYRIALIQGFEALRTHWNSQNLAWVSGICNIPCARLLSFGILRE